MKDIDNLSRVIEDKIDKIVLILFLFLNIILISFGVSQDGMISLGDPTLIGSEERFYALKGIMVYTIAIILSLIAITITILRTSRKQKWPNRESEMQDLE